MYIYIHIPMYIYTPPVEIPRALRSYSVQAAKYTFGGWAAKAATEVSVSYEVGCKSGFVIVIIKVYVHIYIYVCMYTYIDICLYNMYMYFYICI